MSLLDFKLLRGVHIPVKLNNHSGVLNANSRKSVSGQLMIEKQQT